MKQILLIFIVYFLCSLSLRAQPLPRFDVSVGSGCTFQLAKVLNEGFIVGPHAHAAFCWRAAEHSAMSIMLGYDYMRSIFGELKDSLDAEAHFVSLCMRAETYTTAQSFNPFFLIGFGYGSAFMVRPDPGADEALRNTSVQFGVGLPLRLTSRWMLEPMIRFMISEGAAVSIPFTLSLRSDL